MKPDAYDLIPREKRRIEQVRREQVAALTNFKKMKFGWRCNRCGHWVLINPKYGMAHHYEEHQLNDTRKRVLGNLADSIDDQD